MYQRIASILLLVYVSVLFKAAIPFVVDELAHLLFEDRHLAHVHAHHGHYHVHEEMKKIQDEDQQTENNTSRSSISGEEIWLYLNPIQQTISLISENPYKNYHWLSIYYQSISLEIPVPPPNNILS